MESKNILSFLSDMLSRQIIVAVHLHPIFMPLIKVKLNTSLIKLKIHFLCLIDLCPMENMENIQG